MVKFFPDGRTDAKGAAEYLGYAEKTLAMMRTAGTGPRFVKPTGRRVFYYKADLDLWLARNKAASTAQARLQAHQQAEQATAPEAASVANS